MDLPQELVGSMECKTPKSLEYVQFMCLDPKIISLNNHQIWEYPEAIEVYLDMGQTLTKTHLSFAAVSIYFEKLLHLFPTNLFDEDIGERYTSGMDENDHQIDIRTIANLFAVIFESEFSPEKILQILNAILEHFATCSRKSFGTFRYSCDVINYCFVEENHSIAKNVIELILQNFDVKTDALAYTIFNIYKKIYDSGSCQGKIIKPLPEDILTEIFDMLDLKSNNIFRIEKCFYSKSDAILKYFHNLGFDILGIASGTNLTYNLTFDMLKYLHEIGFRFNGEENQFNMIGLESNPDNVKITKWLVDEAFKSDEELFTKLKNFLIKRYSYLHPSVFEAAGLSKFSLYDDFVALSK
jgi:hypothetical protein